MTEAATMLSTHSIVQNNKELVKRKFVRWKTPLFSVCIAIGILGLTTAVIGLVSFGGHNKWWSSEFLHKLKLSKKHSIIVIAAGGSGGLLFLAGGIIGLTLKNTRSMDQITYDTKKKDNESLQVEEREGAEQEKQNAVLTKKEQTNNKVEAVEKEEERSKAETAEKANERFTLLFQSAVTYTQNPETLEALPRAELGASKHRIYMPPELPVVIRLLDSTRLAHTQEAIALCKRERFRHIDIPEIRQQGNFSIEERLPNENAGFIKGMVFYYSHRQFYTPAVQEFTSFLCYASMHDIVNGSTQHSLETLGGDLPRFDNLLLYATEEENGTLYKIGPIDFESFYLHSPPIPTYSDVTNALFKSIQLFPYHAEEIIAVGQKFYTIHPNYIAQLLELSRKNIQFYHIICESNLSFYQKHCITLENPFPLHFSLNQERKEALAKYIGIFVRKEHDSNLNPLRRLNGDPDRTAQCIQEEFVPQIFNFIELWITKIFTNRSRKKLPKNYGELIEARAIINCNLSNIVRFSAAAEIHNQEIFADEFPTYDYIVIEIFNQLVLSEEIAYFKYYERNGSCIFFL